MKSLNYIIVEIENEYINEVNGIISNLDNDDTFFIAREAKVVSAPDFTVLKEGDKVICHHNIFRLKGSVNGNVVKSDYNIENNLYYVPFTECFMYKRDNQDWISLSPFCFVKPIKQEKDESVFKISDSEHQKNTHKGYKRLHGILTYPCKELIEFKGLEIIFSEYSEYEFIIDGELLYKMKTTDILASIK